MLLLPSCPLAVPKCAIACVFKLIWSQVMENHIKPSGDLHSLQNRGHSGQPAMGRAGGSRALAWNGTCHPPALFPAHISVAASFSLSLLTTFSSLKEMWPEMAHSSITHSFKLSFIFIQTLHRQGLIWPVLLGACPWTNQVCQGHSPTASM